MRRFQLFCLFGLVTSLGIWALPNRLKPYHIQRNLDDYKIFLVERDSEWGFASDGIVKLHVASSFGGSRAAIATIRQQWTDTVSRSKVHWPSSSFRPHFDEFGPNQTLRDNGVEAIQEGWVFCIPYSVFALIFAMPLVWHLVFRRRKTAAQI